MDASQAQKQQEPQLCVKGCSFFGNPTTAGMCSKCYREHEANEAKTKALEDAMMQQVQPAAAALHEPQQAEPAAQAAPAEAPAPAAAPAAAGPSTPAGEPPADESPAPKSGPTRCDGCRKKVGLTGFVCKCGKTFCGSHRYAEAHACTYDYKTAARERLAENNPLVQAAKVTKI